MEAAVLLGLVAVGYLKNKDNNDKHPIINTNEDDLKLTNGNNIYDSGDYYTETKNEVKDLAKSNFQKSFNEGSNIINNKKIENDKKIEGFIDDRVFSNNSEQYISNDQFLMNDQGI